MKIYMISDTKKKGGGGKKSVTKASRRKRNRKPKVRTVDEWADDLPF